MNVHEQAPRTMRTDPATERRGFTAVEARFSDGFFGSH
jgi:hypothetical protein